MNKFYKVSSSLPSMKKAVMLALVFVVFLSLASADFEIDDDYTDIEQNYLGGLKIKGKINMSFEEQENEMFNSNFDGGARLYDVLKNMSYDSGEDFACTPFGCRDGYSPSDGTTSKEKNVNGTGFFGGRVRGVGRDGRLQFTHRAQSGCRIRSAGRRRGGIGEHRDGGVRVAARCRACAVQGGAGADQVGSGYALA